MRFPEGLDLRTYGQQLLAGREAKGWTQQQLSKRVSLPVPFIRALESGEPGMLPEIPYVMSMYRKAATAVGVNPEPMIQACKAFQAREGYPLIHHQPRSPQPEPQRRNREPSKPAGATTPQKARAGKDKARGTGDWVVVLAGCGLGLALIALALLKREQLNNLWLALGARLATTAPEAETVQEEPTSQELATRPQQITDGRDQPQSDGTNAQPVSPDGELEQQFEEPEAGTVRFIFAGGVNDNRSSWIRVEDARGVLLFENTPEPSTSVDLPTASGMRVRAGRPGLVRWQQPGQPPQPLPQPGAGGVWIELIPSPVADPMAPVPQEAAAPLDPTPVPAPENRAPTETPETPEAP